MKRWLVGSSEEFYHAQRLRLKPIVKCLCPQQIAVPVSTTDWPWIIRNRHHLRQLIHAIGSEAHEWLLAIYVTAELHLLSVETVGIGSVSGVDVPIGRIIHRGRMVGASGFFLAHNHPSGDPTPSKADIQATMKIAQIAEAMDVHLIEHVVVAGQEIRTVGYW